MTTPHDANPVAEDPSSGSPSAGAATAPVHRNGLIVWTLRLVGLHALVNGSGFGALTIPAAWHLAHDRMVWNAFGMPTYGNRRFEDLGINTTVPLLLAFFGACLVLAVGGALLLVPRSIGVVLTLAGMVMCAPFWWGFNLPLAWVNAAVIMVLFALASVARVLMLLGPTLRRPASSRGFSISREPSSTHARTRTSQDRSSADPESTR
jgi:hypothetical protein